MKLAELQRFFYESVRSDTPPRDIERAFVGTQKLSAVRRMSIYHSAYWSRQLRTLRETFPSMSRALGDERFQRFARSYLVQRPSEKPAIEFVGERFPAFVEERRAELPSLAPALARLEWARTEALLAPDPRTRVRREELAGLELWRFRAVLASHVRILRLPKQALAFAANEDDDANPDISRDDLVGTVVSRRSHKVWHGPVDEPEGRAIELLASGRTFAEVCEAFGDRVSLGDIASTIGAWIDKGWLERLEEGGAGDA
jgi:hypothetical protein